MKSKRVSARVNVKPRKVYIKDINEWKGKSAGLVLERSEALKLAVGLIKSSIESEEVDVTVFPKAKTPTVTVTYLKK